jgi:RimJ/RimL family protein N-acetyltransferase
MKDLTDSHMEMTQHFNDLGQPIGKPVTGWSPPPYPSHKPMDGCYCRLEPLDSKRHVRALFELNALDSKGQNWTYLSDGPFSDLSDYRAWLDHHIKDSGSQFYAIIDHRNGEPCGVASYLRITPSSGSLEVGNIHFSNALKKTPAATEAMYLMMANAFELGYRRYEWKCDSLNASSRAAAERLGFAFEGIFRQAMVYKGRNRDTAWYSVIDTDWPSLRQKLEQWLDPSNFDDEGRQLTRLSQLT